MKNYKCPNCDFIVTYAGDKEKDVNCPMCHNKFVTGKANRVNDFVEKIDEPISADPIV